MLVWYLISYICRKTETLRKLTETCGNEERVFVLLKLYRNLLHQVSADGNLTESSWNYTIVSALLKLYRKLQLQVSMFQFCWNSIFHPVQIMLDQIQCICKRHLKQPDLTDVQNLLHRLRSVLVYFEFWCC